MRNNNRKNDEMREVKVTKNYIIHPEGSVLIEFGNTKVICNATIEEKIPRWLKMDNSSKGIHSGWIAAEYSMLPRATNTRVQRESIKGKISGRTMEIQRLIGRSLRAVIDLEKLGDRTIMVDCDVIQADGGTRTASVTGAFVALVEACASFYAKHGIFPVRDYVAAVSVGINAENEPLLDLCYEEDSAAMVDMNIVMTGAGTFVEVQGTGEGRAFARKELNALLDLGEQGIRTLIDQQKVALGDVLSWLPGREG